VIVFAEDGTALAQQAAAFSGVAKVIQVDNSVNTHPVAAILAPQIVAVSDGYSHIFGPSTTFGKDLMPRVAALLGVNQVSDIMSVLGSYSFKRPIYAGNAIVTVEAPADLPLVATVRTASYSAAPEGESAPVEATSVDAEIPDHTRFIELNAGKSDRPDLQTAARVVSGGPRWMPVTSQTTCR
jgi:electron transfer flavoprotein alpha subunit